MWMMVFALLGIMILAILGLMVFVMVMLHRKPREVAAHDARGRHAE